METTDKGELGIAEDVLKAGHRKVGDDHVVDFKDIGIKFEVSRLDIGKEIHAWVRVTSTLPGTPTLLTDQRYNLSGPRGRADMIRYLERRCPDVKDWAEVVERMCFELLTAIRVGEPIEHMPDVGSRPQVLYRAHPIAINAMPVVLFGQGGCGKTTLASLIALAVQSGQDLCGLTVEQGNVLYLDWETDAYTVSERIAAMARGQGITEPDAWRIAYRACYAPLYEEAHSIGKVIDDEHIQLVIVDSLGAACGGDKNSQEVTQRMFAAMRSWKTAVLCIDHEAKEQMDKPRTNPTPYGSVYTITNARSVWRVRGAGEENGNTLHVGLFQTKINVDRRQQPMGFQFVYGDDEILAEREDVRDVPEMHENLTASQRIKMCLLQAKKSVTVQDIAEDTGLKENIVRTRLNEMAKQGVVVKINVGNDSALRWAMKAGDDYVPDYVEGE